MLQGLLLQRQGVGTTAATQLLFGQLHRGRCRFGFHADLGEHRVAGRQAALLQAICQLRHFLAQTSFGNRERGDVLATLLIDGAAAVAQPVEGAGHHFLLPGHESFRRLTLRTTTTATATLLFGLTIVLRERSDFEEVDIAAAAVARSILRHGVIRYQVARYQRHLFQEQRVRGACIARPARRAVLHHDALFRATIHAIAQLERDHTQVITGLHRYGDFIGVRRLRVAPRLLDGHARPAIGNRINHVLHGTGHRGAVGGDQVHVIESAFRDLEATGYCAVTFDCHRCRGAIVEAQHAARHLAGDLGVHHDGGTHDRRHVATVFHVLGRHAAIRREVEVERHVRHRRQVVHRERVGGRPHVGRLHVVLGGLGDIEQPRAETRRVGFGAHGQSLPFTGGIAAEHQLRAVGGETHQGGMHFDRATARHRHVARLDAERAHRHRRFGRTEGHEQQLGAFA